ncbi:hypothetical protein CC86DRAFT_402735 [Ophiobolus disseminans]|uniref:Uncharacterized protein n=1 Tax=Ophiobolus disseminans TaxID=1469910 RepID=A0A6A7ABV5_9PLEO|nr:hypothetical protein CC86DRAFT_402735 [Ophiobolus disseminans]
MALEATNTELAATQESLNKSNDTLLQARNISVDELAEEEGWAPEEVDERLLTYGVRIDTSDAKRKAEDDDKEGPEKRIKFDDGGEGMDKRTKADEGMGG